MNKYLKKVFVAAPVAGITLAFTPGIAAADSVTAYQQQDANYHVLEVQRSGVADGDPVGVWRSNGSLTQYWYEAPVTGTETYFVMSNANSRRMMDAYSDCSVHQYGGGVTASQRQRMWRLGSYKLYYGNYTYRIHNRSGCNGDPYRDLLFAWGEGDTARLWYFYGEVPESLYYWRPAVFII